MDFRTKFIVKPLENKITYNDKLLFLGSCFAENMSSYFKQYRFQVVVNPFGILYHPLAVDRIIDIALDNEYKPEEYSFEHQKIWSNFDAHSSLSDFSKEKLIANLKSSKLTTIEAINNSNFIFITLGTAWVYKYLNENKIVANCHKLPQKLFKKQILKFSRVKTSLLNITSKIKQVNAKAKVVFTLSPVRHLKDGFVENQRSKSTLHLAIQEIVKDYENIYYFPSYEILLDDLRDYRFYNKDMIHPNQQALDYIWLQLKNSLLCEETINTFKKVESINNRINHRFFNPESEDSKFFAKTTKRLIEEFSKSHPQIKF